MDAIYVINYKISLNYNFDLSSNQDTFSGQRVLIKVGMSPTVGAYMCFRIRNDWLGFAIFHQTYKTQKDWAWIFYASVSLGLVSCIYVFIKLVRSCRISLSRQPSKELGVMAFWG